MKCFDFQILETDEMLNNTDYLYTQGLKPENEEISGGCVSKLGRTGGRQVKYIADIVTRMFSGLLFEVLRLDLPSQVTIVSHSFKNFLFINYGVTVHEIMHALGFSHIKKLGLIDKFLNLIIRCF